jgi:hypothetical protein
MPPITIDVFSEGKTEKEIIEKLHQRGIIPYRPEERGGGGDREMLRRLKVRLRAWFDLAQDQREPLLILVLRDLDTHRTISGLRDSISNIVRQHISDASLVVHPTHHNVFTLQAGISGLRLALHIASQRYHQGFIKSTIDDYVLNLALRGTTAQSLLQDCRSEDWTITADQLMNKVRDEIPALLSQNGIPRLVEAKEYIRLYAALLQTHTSPPVFAQKAVAHARDDDLREVFAPLLAAVQSLEADSAPT